MGPIIYTIIHICKSQITNIWNASRVLAYKYPPYKKFSSVRKLICITSNSVNLYNYTYHVRVQFNFPME